MLSTRYLHRNRKVRITTLVMLFFTGIVTAQPLTDTLIHIQDVVISLSRNDLFRHDIRSEEYGNTILRRYEGESLSRLLLSEGALNIRSNGAGGAASSLSIRGTSASHVQVSWNGFPINSVTLGSSDISMIPAGGFDRITVVYSASGAVYGSGTFGGAVALTSEPQLEDTLSGSIHTGWQSLQTYSGAITLQAGTTRVAGRLSAWGIRSAGRFTYYDYIMQRERTQSDGSWSNHGLIQNVAVRLSGSSSLDAGLWYQVKPYSIPSRIGSTSYENQSDSTLRLFLGYKYLGNRWSVKVKAARFGDRQNYAMKGSADAPVNSIESRIATINYYGDAGFRYHLPSGLTIDAGITGSLSGAEVAAYGGRREEKGVALFGGARQTLERLIIQASIRKEWFNTYNSPLLPSVGLRWEASPGRWLIRANYSQKYRKPTFNDLFWVPGGDPDLRPERGYTLEAGSEVTLIKREHSSLMAEVTPYLTNIREMIVWRPAGVYWAPQNYQRVRSAGADLKVTWNTGREKWRWSSSLKVALNSSIATEESGDERRPMLYSPHLITSWNNRFTLGIFSLEITDSFTASRLYDEGRQLKPYNLVDIRGGADIPAGRGKVGIDLSCNNATGTTYEMIRLYPMPGRYWSVMIDYTF